MTSFISNNSNSFEADGIRIEIWEPINEIVLPIPENTPSANTPMQLGMSIINNNSAPFLFHGFENIIPELLTSNGQLIPKQIAIKEPIVNNQIHIFTQSLPFSSILTPLISNLANRFPRRNSRKIDKFIVKQGVPIIAIIKSKLLWHNNLLRLQVSTMPYYLINHGFPDEFWFFDDLMPGIYQLRFTYDINCKARPDFDSDTREVKTVQELEPKQLTTSFVNMHFIQPVSTNKKAIEVNDVQFQIEMPEPVLHIPAYLPGAKTSIKLGIRATNNTSTPLRFERLNALIPILMEDDGKVLEPDGDMMRLWVSEGLPYYSAMPGESAFFVLDSKLSRNFFNQLQLAIPNEAGGFWYFRNLKLGKYKLQFMYEVRAPITIGKPEESVSENVWTGCIVMPIVELHIVR
ncbi:hypothetical protein H6G91_31575 [Nostoc muscorum FACHB-395]|nr:hypothetical protein [Desmonostoc muscorum FACHB-395]